MCVAEPHDAVWWIDAAAVYVDKSTTGLQTHMFTGNQKNSRYHTYIEKGMEVVRRYILEDKSYIVHEK